jgi:tetratricopeptide (TPR) repeat protein
MAIDPYALCPCGSGKKLKFCCSDVVGEIEKIHRMIEGDQPRAALRHVEHTLASHARRPSLLDLKASLELSLGEIDSARKTVDEFVRAHPDSATAHACHAILLSETGEARAAVAALQKAIAIVEREMPQRVFEAIGAVGGALLAAGHVLAAQAHLWLHAALAPKDDTRAYQAIVGMNHYAGLPLILRDQVRFRRWPKDAPWKSEADQATRLADQGKWQAAVTIVDRLGQRYGADPTLVFNRALLGGWLADDRALVAGLHAYAQLDVPLDDAIEAEAIAQLLDPDQKEQTLDTVRQTYSVTDQELLVSRLAADRRIQHFRVDPSMFAEGDEPPPRHTYAILNKPMPESGANLSREAIPRFAGILAVYGRQTDRPERLEFTVDQGPTFDASVQALKEIAGDALGEKTDEKVIGHVTPTEQALNWRWHMPRDTPREDRRRLLEEERQAAMVERWPELPRPALGGKTPREAAGDPQLRIPLMAAVSILEQGAHARGETDVVAKLREKLGLPQPEPIEPGGESLMALSLVRVPRLNLDAISDDDLVQLYRRAVLANAQGVVVRLSEEAVRRPSLAQRIPPAEAYQRLIAAEAEPERAISLIADARAASEAAGESTATWDLAELELHITSGNAEEAKELLARIERQHLDDPQVAAALYQLLYETGVIPTEGMPMQPPVQEELPLAAAGAAAQPAPGRIWTPDSDRPSTGKSALWTPS